VNVAPPPGSLRPTSPDEPLPVAEVSRARTLLGRIGDILLGKVATLLLASLGRFHFKGKLLTLGTFAFPLLLLVFTFVRSLPLALLVLVGTG